MHRTFESYLTFGICLRQVLISGHVIACVIFPVFYLVETKRPGKIYLKCHDNSKRALKLVRIASSKLGLHIRAVQSVLLFIEKAAVDVEIGTLACGMMEDVAVSSI